MGAILSSRMKDDGKIVFEISVDYEESIQLQGHMDNVHLFSENASDIETNISQRGKNEATKYFLIPKSFINSSIDFSFLIILLMAFLNFKLIFHRIQDGIRCTFLSFVL